ncbi:MAG: thiamine phosphate synthase [Clostridiales bacterium]|jgi:thiamine-phosphate pyrophosphorylase|nr:thiamine phosphate synthase [Clostridiales bacterium]
MKCDKDMLLLYAVTDRAWSARAPLPEQVEYALRGGVTCVQLREKDLPFDAFLAEAVEIRSLCGVYHVPFIVNDDAEVAARCGADGLHIGQGDMAAADARRLVGDKILGVSVRTVGQALLAERQGADYLGVGAMFPTSTKADADSVSRETLAEIARAVKIPVVAIGGITKYNMQELKGTGISGVALVSAIFGSDDIQGACAELRVLAEQII